jgi:bifunctional lysine-specific demethylase and histidyl-hydroxylase NO66
MGEREMIVNCQARGGLETVVSGRGDLVEAWNRSILFSSRLPPLPMINVSWIESLLNAHMLPDDTRMLKDGGEIPAAEFLHEWRGRKFADAEKVQLLLASGATMLIQQPNRWSPELSNLKLRMTADLNHAAYLALFLTPPDAKGAGLHYDASGVIIRQLSGEKSWVLYSRAENWRTQPWHEGMECDKDAVEFEGTLRPGESLYLPPGVFHDGWTSSSASLHLSIGFPMLSWSSFIQRIVAAAERQRPELAEDVSPATLQNTPSFHTDLMRRVAELSDFASSLDPMPLLNQAIRDCGGTTAKPVDLASTLGPV